MLIARILKSLLPNQLYTQVRLFYNEFIRKLSSAELVPELEDWDIFLKDPRIDPRLAIMLKAYKESQSEEMASSYWAVLSRKNVKQLIESGYENFKQTVALNYFTWLLGSKDPQERFLINNLPKSSVINAKERANLSKMHPYFTTEQSLQYNYITYMLWDYVERTIGKKIINNLSEPQEGNPPSINLNGEEISQDLANSILEYYSITQGFPEISNISTIMELGAGYGRTAYVFLHLLPHLQYVIVDIPPALYISEKYLSSQFPDYNIFKFRPFHSFSQVSGEFYDSQIAFLMPNQLRLLPAKTADIFLAIDCLHEMQPRQIRHYFETVDSLSQYFYLKCWKKTKIPYDNISLTQEDYPFLPHWQNLFFRDCRVQSTYFEAMFQIGRDQAFERPGKSSIKRP
jgi:putative sugar O-methyltransferase